MEHRLFDLTGMTALVTGAAGGIGSAISHALARQGARLALSGTNPSKLRSFREELNDTYGHDHVEITCDLSNTEQVEHLVPAAIDTLDKVDILVNNAGITRDNLAMRMKDEEWDAVIKVNLEAAFRLMRAASKPMMKARFGRIITVTSVVGATGNVGREMLNILAEREVVPEYLLADCTAENLAAATAPLLDDGDAWDKQCAGLSAVVELLKVDGKPPSEQAAQIVLGHLEKRSPP